LHAKRLRELAPNRTVTVLPGEYAQSAEETEPRDAAKPTTILYAGRMIAEKRVPLLVDALALVLRDRPEVRAVLLGNGPERASIETQVHELGLADRITMPGFVDDPTFETLITTAAVLVQPSMREGYGMVVVESAARGVPVVVVEAPDNAATELVTPGINGAIAQRADPDCLAASIKACLDTGPEMRMSTRAWFLANADRLSLGNSLSIIANDLSN
jgi:glycosyltransferase involved in cell wall biosynthesis